MRQRQGCEHEGAAGPAELEGTGVTRIVVGVDESHGARRALRWALEHAEALGASLEAVHAYEFGLAWIDYDAGAEAIERWRQRAAATARDELHRVVTEVAEGGDVTIEEIVVPSDAATALIDQAKGADLLVVGSRGRGAFSGLLLGSVSRRCTEHASCPVVVVPGHAS